MIDPRRIQSNDDLTEQLIALFHRGGWSDHRLADAAGLSPATVHSILTGKTGIPRAKTLAAFVGACGEDSRPWLEARARVAANGRKQPTAQDFFRPLILSHTDLFAGRDVQTAMILDYVKDRRTGYIFVEALSGYGKTSLLANLVDQNPGFCYHFVSQVYKRPGTGFDPTSRSDIIMNLWEQLNPGRLWADDSRRLEMEFQRLVSEQFRNPTVIVLDAVDELEPVIEMRGILPPTLPQGTVIILSARTQGDRSPLRDVWPFEVKVGLHIQLPGLDESAIAELLRQVGGHAQQVAHDAAFAARLQKVSRGDPFYLRFLVEDVASGLLSRENVDQTPSGLEPYLDLQLEMLERSAHRPQHVEILGFLLEAGMLSRDDLLHMVGGLNWLNFDIVMREIHRFLLVHDDQYTFCHDRFREYFRAKAGYRG